MNLSSQKIACRTVYTAGDFFFSRYKRLQHFPNRSSVHPFRDVLENHFRAAVDGFSGIKAHMRCAYQIRNAQQRMIFRQRRILLKYIGSRLNSALFQRLRQCIRVHHRTSGRIDQNSALLHGTDFLRTDQTASFRCQRRVHGHDIRLRHNILQ